MPISENAKAVLERRYLARDEHLLISMAAAAI